MPNKQTPDRDIRNPADDEVEDLGTNPVEDEEIDEDDEEFDEDVDDEDEDAEEADVG